jgi:uncharacterized protein (DUF58 family)
MFRLINHKSVSLLKEDKMLRRSISMKKLLTLALVVAVLAAFTGLSAAQERKAPAKPAATPTPAPAAQELTVTVNVSSKGQPGSKEQPASNAEIDALKRAVEDAVSAAVRKQTGQGQPGEKKVKWPKIKITITITIG